MNNVFFFKNTWESDKLICVTSFSKTYRAKSVDSDALSAITSIVIKSEDAVELENLFNKYNELLKDIKINYIPNIVPIFQYEILKNKKKHRITINMRYRLEDGTLKNIERIEKKLNGNEEDVLENKEETTLNEPEILSDSFNDDTVVESVEESLPYFAVNTVPSEIVEEENNDDDSENVIVINETKVTYKEGEKKKGLSTDFYLWLLVIVSILTLILFIYKGYSLVK